jgi:hypothetical protein
MYLTAQMTRSTALVSTMNVDIQIAMYLYGLADMQNYTNGSSIWAQRISGLLDAMATIFQRFS